VTARLAAHLDVAERTPDVLKRLVSVGVDVDFLGWGDGGSANDSGDRGGDPLDALRDSTIDLALVGIHAMRGSAADELTTVAVLPREEVRDVLVTLAGAATPLTSLAPGSRVGVVGPRRKAFLAAHRPDVEPVVLERSSIQALIEARGDADALPVNILVISALDGRLAGLEDATVEALDPKSWLPEPGQGALALVARHPIAEATALDHLPTRTALRTELALLDALEAASDAPLGCLAQPSGRWIRLWAAAANEDGSRLVRSDLTGALDEPEALGAAVARELDARGYGLVTAAVST
jgi:hydroxymethylbilane synthase